MIIIEKREDIYLIYVITKRYKNKAIAWFESFGFEIIDDANPFDYQENRLNGIGLIEEGDDLVIASIYQSTRLGVKPKDIDKIIVL